MINLFSRKIDLDMFPRAAQTTLMRNSDGVFNLAKYGELPDSTLRVYKQFYTEWLPNSGYELAEMPVNECYMQENRQEVWIAR